MLTFKLVEKSFGVWWDLMNAAKVEIANFHRRFFFLWAVFRGSNLNQSTLMFTFEVYVVAVECIILLNDTWVCTEVIKCIIRHLGMYFQFCSFKLAQGKIFFQARSELQLLVWGEIHV